jgi:hypothetical protein
MEIKLIGTRDLEDGSLECEVEYDEEGFEYMKEWAIEEDFDWDGDETKLVQVWMASAITDAIDGEIDIDLEEVEDGDGI